MTTTHPAHGPVSLERLHQIREILSKAAAQSDGGNIGYAMADAVKVIDGAIAAFGAEPVAWKSVFRLTGHPGSDFEKIFENREAMDAVVSLHERGGFNVTVTPLYTAPPAPVVPTFDEWLELRGNKPLGWVKDAMRESYDACRTSMLQSFGNSEQLDEVGSWNNHRNTPTAKPAIDTGELLKRIEGMEVSVDVSTCDADAGHRYFGTVTEISELDTAKNGYILLVQDAKPNFKWAGNSPATPDAWIPVSERMPESEVYVQLYCADSREQMVGCMEREETEGYFRFSTWRSGKGIYCKPTHWMPLTAPPRNN